MSFFLLTFVLYVSWFPVSRSALDLPESERSVSMASGTGNVYKIHVPERNNKCC